MKYNFCEIRTNHEQITIFIARCRFHAELSGVHVLAFGFFSKTFRLSVCDNKAAVNCNTNKISRAANMNQKSTRAECHLLIDSLETTCGSGTKFTKSIVDTA